MKKLKFKKSVKIIVFFVLIFLIFYIMKVGGSNLSKDKNNNMENEKITEKKTTNEIITSTTTSKVTTSSKTTTSNTTTKSTNIDNEKIKIVDGVLIVNKTYPLPENYVPTDTYTNAEGLNYCATCINIDAYKSYELMKADATSLGLNIWIQSGYRSYDLQKQLYTNYVNRDGKDAADTYSARPGHSEHQTGLAFDLNTITDDFQYTNEGIWINENCYKYGFILRYPKGKEKITGYKYESWHLRYVGEELAKKLYNNGNWITLEEHFNLTSEYKN